MGSIAPGDGLSPSLTQHIASILPNDNTRTALGTSVIPSLLRSISDIAKALRAAQDVTHAGTANTFGDEQLNVDVIAENHVREALALCPSVKVASSEEDPVERPVTHSSSVLGGSQGTEQYTVAFDPLDGSSIIAPNWTVGTIIGIWDGGVSALSQPPAEKQIAAILGVFGPRTTAVVSVRVPGSPATCFEVGFSEGELGGWDVVRPVVRFGDAAAQKTRYFAPANLRAAAEDERYMGLVNHYIRNKYTLRYSGGLVPDVVHALVKGHGVYLSPVTGVSKAKLRRLYELYPLALIIECAGGKAVDPADGSEILAREVRNCDERGGLICGTKEEVNTAISALLGKP
ncbi:fructose-1,6-bisphosphatase class 1/Sedoheputulose-1,7-bisphosphatase [Cercophora newfieldiana]|uniref:Fructose-1,6-bisphosphatase class 1/Sedoheputulose-1,7-bisphosphatase n=1 Tax=Cercophora newfieldiana TaxID=92897 RepID=A0AA39XW49_9PEZI|nr:fructose-1,6-bisphosphatase class 1/Sedoheputulose-1,7-bisphosphatase [Cercophora newfieldiana]